MAVFPWEQVIVIDDSKKKKEKPKDQDESQKIDVKHLLPK